MKNTRQTARWILSLLALTGWALPVSSQERIQALVLTGEDEVHDWRWTSTYLRQVLEESGKFRVEVEPTPAVVLEDPRALARYDLIVVDYDGPRWGPAAEAAFLGAVKQGTGVLLLHAASSAFPDWEAYRKLVGLERERDAGEAPFEAVSVAVPETEHPVVAGLESWADQPDGLLFGWKDVAEGHEVLASGTAEGWGAGGIGTQPVALSSKYGEGRVFQFLLGHVGYGDERSWSSWRDSRFQQLLVRGAEWSAVGKVTPVSKLAPNTLTPADVAAGWRIFAQGESGHGWRGLEQGLKDRWKVENGQIYLLAENGEPLYDEPFFDFEFELEWRVSEEALAAYTAMEARAGRTAPAVSADDPDSIVDARIEGGVLREAAYVLRPPGEWNHLRVVARGYQVDHFLNGIRVLSLGMDSTRWAELVAGTGWLSDPDLGRMPLGRLAQLDAGIDVWLRNVKVRPLLDPVTDPVTGEPPVVAVPLFNGRDLTGWVHRWWGAGEPRDMWTYDAEGNLVCDGGRLDFICTQDSYQDFLLEFEQRWNPVTRQAGKASVLLFMQGDEGLEGADGGTAGLPESLEVRLQFQDVGSIWLHHDSPLDPDPMRTRGPVTTRIERADAIVGEWNRISIRSEDGRLTVYANDVLVNDVSGVGGLPGRIGFLSDVTQFQLRNGQLTPLD